MKFSRVLSNPNDVLPGASITDRALDSQGYLWWNSGTSWHIERRITEGKLFDVQGEPTLHQGENEDVAVTPSGKCWRKKDAVWHYEGNLGEGIERSIKTESLVVLGNLSLAVVDGQILLFDPYAEDQVIGCLRVYPVR